MRRLLLALLMPILPALLGAGEAIPIGESFRLAAPQLGEERLVLLSLPRAYPRSQERYPVLYLLDGDAHFTHTRGTVDFLVRNGLMPDLILVALPNTRRTRDLSPTVGHFTDPEGQRGTVPGSGGGEAFLDFLEQTLIPHVEAHYRTQPFRILAGHSLGGMMVLHALSTRPRLFQGLLAASPALAWDEDFPLRALASFLSTRPALRATLFVSMADEEAGEPRPNRFDRLQSLLRSAKAGPGFNWEARAFADEDHGSVVLRTHYWGLRRIFAGWRPPLDPKSRQFRGGLKELKAHYAGLAERLGYPVQPPEATVNAVGYQALARNNGEEAIALFRHNVALHPASPNVHDSLGEALEKAGLKAEAAACYARAVALAEPLADPNLAVYRRNRARLEAALK